MRFCSMCALKCQNLVITLADPGLTAVGVLCTVVTGPSLSLF